MRQLLALTPCRGNVVLHLPAGEVLPLELMHAFEVLAARNAATGAAAS